MKLSVRWLLGRLRRGPAALPRPGFRPALEALEAREVPALIANQVLIPFDSGFAPFVVAPASGGGGAAQPGARLAPGQDIPPALLECIREFEALNRLSPTREGQGRGQGEGQLRYSVCQFTGSETNPYNIIEVAAPA